MRITIKGQVTIPQHIREKLGITPSSEIEFIEEQDRVYITKKLTDQNPSRKYRKLRGAATIRMTTDEIMILTRMDS